MKNDSSMTNPMTHASVFSGIGGPEVAAAASGEEDITEGGGNQGGSNGGGGNPGELEE